MSAKRLSRVQDGEPGLGDFLDGMSTHLAGVGIDHACGDVDDLFMTEPSFDVESMKKIGPDFHHKLHPPCGHKMSLQDQWLLLRLKALHPLLSIRETSTLPWTSFSGSMVAGDRQSPARTVPDCVYNASFCRLHRITRTPSRHVPAV